MLYKQPFIHVGLLAMVLVTPLALGCVYAWGKLFLQASIAVLVICRLFFYDTPLINNRLFLFFVFFLIFVGMQLVPLPSGTLHFIAPYQTEVWYQLAIISNEGARYLQTLSIEPQATASLGIILSLYCFSAWLAGTLIAELNGNSQLFVNRFAWAISVAGFLVATVGIVQVSFGAREMYWIFRPTYSDTFMGPFVNRNHFSGYLEMAVPWSTSLFLIGLYRCKNSIYSLGRNLAVLLFSVLVITIILVAIILSSSRSGVMIAIATLAFQTIVGQIILSKPYRVLSIYLGFGGLFIAIVAVIMITPLYPLFQRFIILAGNGISTNIRLQLISDTLDMISNSPLFGVGLGAFGKVFTNFKTSPLQAYFDHAHCDYLELFSETGIIGGGLLLGFVALVVWQGTSALLLTLRCRTIWNDNLFYNCIFLVSSLTSLGALALHSFVDFNLHIPANAFLFFTNCGVVVGLTGQLSIKTDLACV